MEYGLNLPIEILGEDPTDTNVEDFHTQYVPLGVCVSSNKVYIYAMFCKYSDHARIIRKWLLEKEKTHCNKSEIPKDILSDNVEDLRFLTRDEYEYMSSQKDVKIYPMYWDMMFGYEEELIIYIRHAICKRKGEVETCDELIIKKPKS